MENVWFLKQIFRDLCGQGNWPGKISLRPSEAKQGSCFWWHALRRKRPKDHGKYIDLKESLFAMWAKLYLL